MLYAVRNPEKNRPYLYPTAVQIYPHGLARSLEQTSTKLFEINTKLLQYGYVARRDFAVAAVYLGMLYIARAKIHLVPTLPLNRLL